MSNAKWCDACGSIFPEGAEGSESGVGRITVNTPNGPQMRDQVRDFCPDCVTARESAMGGFNPARILREIEKVVAALPSLAAVPTAPAQAPEPEEVYEPTAFTRVPDITLADGSILLKDKRGNVYAATLRKLDI